MESVNKTTDLTVLSSSSTAPTGTTHYNIYKLYDPYYGVQTAGVLACLFIALAIFLGIKNRCGKGDDNDIIDLHVYKAHLENHYGLQRQQGFFHITKIRPTPPMHGPTRMEATLEWIVSLQPSMSSKKELRKMKELNPIKVHAGNRLYFPNMDHGESAPVQLFLIEPAFQKFITQDFNQHQGKNVVAGLPSSSNVVLDSSQSIKSFPESELKKGKTNGHGMSKHHAKTTLKPDSLNRNSVFPGYRPHGGVISSLAGYLSVSTETDMTYMNIDETDEEVNHALFQTEPPTSYPWHTTLLMDPRNTTVMDPGNSTGSNYFISTRL